MLVEGIKNPSAKLNTLGIDNHKTQYWNLSPETLADHAVEKGMASIADSGAIMIKTGKFTGRSPKDRYEVTKLYKLLY